MSTDLTPQQKFEERIKAKLVDDIGQLLPDDVLSAMVEAAMKEAFFKPRKIVDNSGYHQRIVDGDPWLVEVLRDLVGEQVKHEVKAFAEANREEITRQLDMIIKDGLLRSMLQHMDNKLQWSLQEIAQQAINNAFPGGQ